jgi:SHS2 domain-containing protein
MTHRHWTIEHTADIGVEAWGDSLGELLAGLAEGVAALVCPPQQVRPLKEVRVHVQAEDLEALAVDFLSAVLAKVQVLRFMVRHVYVEQAGELAVEARLEGEPLDANRHELHEEIKAITYHQVRIAQASDGWSGRVFVDI